MQRKSLYILIACMLLIVHCKDPYSPQVTNQDLHYLVVDGTIVGGAGAVTSFTLSRTTPVKSPSTGPLVETNATVTVESQGGESYPLPSQGDGTYVAGNLPLSVGNMYRVHIFSGDDEFVSDYTEYKETPPIDSISNAEKNEGMQIYVSAHDPANNTHYYRWKWVETWEYHSALQSALKFDTTSPYFDPANPDLVTRPYAEMNALFYCWKTYPSRNILLGTSSQLTADVIDKAPIDYINPGDDRLSVKYSLLVSQTALTREAYNYWVNVKKITEQLGDIFGPLPSEIHGNVHNVKKPDEMVVGFVVASTMVQERVFITPPPYWRNPLSPCIADTVKLFGDPAIDRWTYIKRSFSGGGYYPLSWADPLHTMVLGSGGDCVDCRTKGGFNQRPDFWQ